MSFSLEILDDILINKIAELDKKINIVETLHQYYNSSNMEFNNRFSILEDRISFVENQCKILSNLFNVGKNQTSDNKLIQTILLDLTTSIHNNGVGLNVLKQRFDESENRDSLEHFHNTSLHDTVPSEIYTYKDKKTWTKVKKKKKNRRK